VIGDEDVGIGGGCRRLHQLLRVAKDLDVQAGRQFGRDAAGGIGGDIAQEERFHSPEFSPAPLRRRARFASEQSRLAVAILANYNVFL
jgi:hypothetical protein